MTSEESLVALLLLPRASSGPRNVRGNLLAAIPAWRWVGAARFRLDSRTARRRLGARTMRLAVLEGLFFMCFTAMPPIRCWQILSPIRAVLGRQTTAPYIVTRAVPCTPISNMNPRFLPKPRRQARRRHSFMKTQLFRPQDPRPWRDRRRGKRASIALWRAARQTSSSSSSGHTLD